MVLVILNNSHVLPHVQMLIALRFYATSRYQQVVDDVVNIHQTRAGRIVNHVIKCNSKASSTAHILSQQSGSKGRKRVILGNLKVSWPFRVLILP